MHHYLPGQRWLSVSEPELGLGLVVTVSPRELQVLFPATGDMRTYAAAAAPLKRAHFAPGDEIRGQEGQAFTVESVHEEDGLLTYSGEGHTLPETALADSLSFEDPEARLLAGHIDPSRLFDLRLATLRHRHRVQRSPVRGFVGGRVELLPHQLYIAHDVCRRPHPRVLLADEVGLGKTIEACLVLHRMIVCGAVQRALVLVPRPLIHQWFVEFLRRFNLTFRIADDSATGNPFTEDQLVLCGIDSLVADKARARQALDSGWDMLIVDEAHRLRWQPDNPSPAYALVEQFAATVPGLLLLTASPEQTGLESHFARLRLLDPNRYPSLPGFLAEHEHHAAVARRADEVLASGDETALRDLLDRHGPGRVMFRNTRAAMTGFPKRIPHLVPLEASDDNADPAVQWLGDLLRDNPSVKVLVICHTSREVRAAASTLLEQAGIESAAFHEELPLVQCDRQAAWFAEPDGPRVLIASGIGGEGRNFQFVNHLVLMDVPRDPDLLEQRIGRLDRIGQSRNIHIHVPYARGSADESIVRWLHEGLNAFAEPIAGGYAMLCRFGDRFESVDAELIAETRAAYRDLRERIAAGRDRLLELNSCRPAIAEKLIADIRAEESDETLEDYMRNVFEQFGVGVESLGDHDHVLKTDLLYCEEFPLPRDPMRITFNREHALARPTLTLLSWDHPMVEGAIDLILGTDRGTCAVARSDSVEGILLQAVYVLETLAPDNLEIDRFLPATPIVIQLDARLDLVQAEPVAEADADQWIVLDNSAFRTELFPAMLAKAGAAADERIPAIIASARHAMQEAMQTEIRRLRDLRAINDHVRREEIDELITQTAALDKTITTARPRLDALRIVVGPET